MKDQKMIGMIGNKEYEKYEIHKKNEKYEYMSENMASSPIMFDAELANRYAKESLMRKSEQQLNYLIDCIQKLAAEGYFEVYLDDILSPTVKKELESRGFKIQDITSYYRSNPLPSPSLPPSSLPFLPCRTLISWEFV